MIISDTTSTRSTQKIVLWAIAALGLLALVVLFYPTNKYKSKPLSTDTYFCSAEEVVGNKFFSNGVYFTGGNEQSEDFAKSGKYSCKLEKSDGHQYGIGMKLQDFAPGETYRASVWRYRAKGGDDGFLAVSGGEGKFNKTAGVIIKSVDSWELLEIDFQIPYYSEVKEVSIYTHTLGNYDVYFDDFQVQKTGKVAPIGTSNWSPATINLHLKYKALEKIKAKRNQALIDGILESAEDDWVKGKIFEDSSANKINVKLRLKGDWLDHLVGDKWSFRIKTKNGETFNRLPIFSVHTPKTRSFLHEWVLHQLFEQEDVLTTFYDFVFVNLNEKSLGVYAIEEHFDKVLLERQKRREGPIIKFSENGFWAGLKRQKVQFGTIDNRLNHTIKKPAAAPVEPFQQKQIATKPSFQEQFSQASTLLNQYKEGTVAPGEIFDLQKMAKYFAICDALSAYHGITWHNQRFYYNPVTSKLEPIGFDGFGDKVFRKDYYTGMGALNEKRIDNEAIENLLFLDVEFTKYYSYYLYKYTSRSFLNAFFASIEEELHAREKLIQIEFQNYTFDQDKVIANAQRMNTMTLPFDDYSLKAFVQEKDQYSKILKVTSYHGLPILLLGSGASSNNLTDSLQAPMLFESYYKRSILERRQNDSTPFFLNYSEIKKAYDKQESNNYQVLKVKKDHEYLFFKPLGIDSVFTTKIHNWKISSEPTTRQAIFENIDLVSNKVYTVSDQMVFFKKGKYIIDEAIIIPPGYRVLFEAGVQMDFIKRAKFITQSPVLMSGTEEEPIIIKSSDKTAQGFTVMQTGKESNLNYVVFDGFNTLDETGWSLTGAVTFYEADVMIHHSEFKNNVCEDALNIIRSTFTFEKSLISNTFADGLDADFCKGNIQNASFINTGNDGMDFSGSVILIDHTRVQNAGDKGISVGEDSDTSIGKISITDSNIAVAAKDLSTLVIQNIDIKKCKQGFIAFQKKPEYGGANIIIHKYSADKIRRLHNIREGCTLQLVNKMIRGEELGVKE